MSPRTRAWIGTVAFLCIAPAIVAGLAPWLVAGRRSPDWGPLGLLGVVLVAAGAGVLLHAFVRFAVQGVGTPSPTAPTQHLVISGVYRWVRNPMYLAVLAIIAGQAAWFHRWSVAGYGVAVAVAVVTFVRSYEEPTLLRTYGDDYAAYRRTVPGWYPRRPARGT